MDKRIKKDLRILKHGEKSRHGSVFFGSANSDKQAVLSLRKGLLRVTVSLNEKTLRELARFLNDKIAKIDEEFENH